MQRCVVFALQRYCVLCVCVCVLLCDVLFIGGVLRGVVFFGCPTTHITFLSLVSLSLSLSIPVRSLYLPSCSPVAMFPIKRGVAGIQQPAAALVCNFPKAPEQMSHSDVTTFFHEFGHLMCGNFDIILDHCPRALLRSTPTPRRAVCYALRGAHAESSGADWCAKPPAMPRSSPPHT